MRVQRVLMPGTGFESWTVLGDDQMPVEPIERFLSYLASIEKSPNTIKVLCPRSEGLADFPGRARGRLGGGGVGGCGRVRRVVATAAAGPRGPGGGAADGG